MIRPATVWLARPGTDRIRRGTLAMEEGGLTFTMEDGSDLRLSGSDLEGVRRLRGTPVLEVRYRGEGGPELLLCYFVEPPPLVDRGATPLPGGRSMRRITAIRHLREANRRLRPVLEEWARTARETMGDG